MNLVELNLLAKDAFKNGYPDFDKLKKVKQLLYEVPKNQRNLYRDFIEEFQESLFENAVDLPGLNFENYFKENKKDSTKATVDLSFNPKAEFLEVLNPLIDALEFDLHTLKNYFILDLRFDLAKKYNLLVIYDNSYFIAPFKKKLKEKFPDCSLIDFDSFDNNFGSRDQNLICLLFLESRKANENKIQECLTKVNKMIEKFDDFSAIHLKSLKKTSGKYNYIEEKDTREFISELEFTIGSSLTNIKLNNDEEKIIKKLLSPLKCPVLEYNLIAKGFSGASVIEVRPKKPFASERSRRYIVKYSKIDDEKLNKEHTLFQKAFGAFEGLRDYTCLYARTKTYEGLLYEYAKTDSNKNSYPFADIISDNENPHHKNARDCITRLYEIDPFQIWDSTIENQSIILYDCYKNLVKENKTKQAIAKILKIPINELNRNDLIINFEKIKNIELKSSLKICHGDLHTNNFFVDSEIYLIDFGLTDLNHSLLDFVSLEVSLKFNHFPNYISDNELKDIETLLIADESFDASNHFHEINRPELRVILEAIHENRLKSKKYIVDNKSYLEYYLALYFMTLKQIRYSDMNQYYAIISARILGAHIVKFIPDN